MLEFIFSIDISIISVYNVLNYHNGIYYFYIVYGKLKEKVNM